MSLYDMKEGQFIFGALSVFAAEKNAYFDCLPISNRKCDDLQSILNDKNQPHCHSSSYWGMKFEQE